MKERPSCRSCNYISKPMVSHWWNSRSEYYCTHPDINRCAAEYTEKTGKRIVKMANFLGYGEPPKTSLRWCPFKKQTTVKEENDG